MEPHGHRDGSLGHEHPHAHEHDAVHHYEPKPLDLSYRRVIRTVLWVIAGAVLVGLIVWWVRT